MARGLYNKALERMECSMAEVFPDRKFLAERERWDMEKHQMEQSVNMLRNEVLTLTQHRDSLSADLNALNSSAQAENTRLSSSMATQEQAHALELANLSDSHGL